nr:uncharacterized protein LOC108080842 [Drosophila kikkawai]
MVVDRIGSIENIGSPILSDLQKVNKSYQSKNANATELLNDLEFAINSLKKGVTPQGVEFDIFEIDDIERYADTTLQKGYDFEKKIKYLNINRNKEKEIRDRCTYFTIELIKQLKQRLPYNFKVLKQIDVFSVTKILCAVKKNITEILEFLECKNIAEIERQYNNINLIKWENISDTPKFWFEVLNYKDSGGNRRFFELATVAINILCLPWPNAEIERVFSQVNLIESKLTNSLGLNTINSILSIRLEKSCVDYEVPTQYLRMIGTNKSYANEDQKDIDNIMDIF